MLLLMSFIANAVPRSRLLAPLLHGGQPGLDDWLPIVAFGISLVAFVGFAVYNAKQKQPAPPDEPARERNR
jgi:hypothetical protein